MLPNSEIAVRGTTSQAGEPVSHGHPALFERITCSGSRGEPVGEPGRVMGSALQGRFLAYDSNVYFRACLAKGQCLVGSTRRF